MKNGDTPAFPGEGSPYFESNDGKQRLRAEFDIPQEPSPGLTKRELFAAMAMQGYLSGRSADSPSSMRPEAVAVGCVLYADALLAELAQ